MKKISQQRKWQIAKRALGLCAQCGAPSVVYQCEKCRQVHRKRLGLNAWKPGSHGPIPITASESEIVEHVLMRLYAH